MQSNYQPALQLAQSSLRSLSPEIVSERSGADLVDGSAGRAFQLTILGREYRVPLKELDVLDAATGKPASVPTTLVVLHYLAMADGSPPRREWIPFRSLPGGNVYEQAFRQQCLDPLVATFGRDPEGFSLAAEKLSGARATFGDLSYLFQPLPMLPMACVLWLADEEQGAEANLLFDAVAPFCLPTEDLAALGRMVAYSLIRSREAAQ